MTTDNLIGRTGKCFYFTCNSLVHNERMLNVGCGNAWLENYLSKEKKDVKYFACELDENLLLNENECSEANVYYTAASALDLPYKDGSFEIVTCFDVIEHIPKNTEYRMLYEIRRVLKPGGTLLLSTPRQGILNNFTDFAWYFGHRHYSLKRLHFLMNNAGFSDFNVELQGGKYELFETWALYFYKYLFHKKIPNGIHKLFKKKIVSEKVKNYSISFFVKVQKL
ncbi:MAG: class I SAM-dependent methyltransferase [Pseudomonadota bacterium]